jgi:hypothetical protein
MKKVVLTLTATLACVAAFAQGKISFQTDSLHLAYDSASGSGPTGSGLTADLYMGTSSGSLFLYSSSTFSAVPGKWNSVSVAANANATTGAPAIPGGSVVFVLAQIRDSAGTPANTIDPLQLNAAYAAARGWAAYGWSQEFQFTLGASISYPFMYTAPGWAPGTQNMDQYGAGSRGAIAVTAVPEPASFALAGLGLASMLVLRRRK